MTAPAPASAATVWWPISAILLEMADEPKYRDVFRTIRSEILSGAFDARTRFPSEGQLMRKFGVSRNTVRAALEELKRSGMIETRNGAGTFLTAAAKRVQAPELPPRETLLDAELVVRASTQN